MRVTDAEVRTAMALNRALARQQIKLNEATLQGERTVFLRCRVVGVQGQYRAPNLLKHELSTTERLGDLEPMAFDLILRGQLGPEDRDAMKALAELSRTGGSVIVSVEVSE